MITLDLVAEIKRLVNQKYGVNLHYHDTCGGGMYFSLDVKNDDISAFVLNYFAQKKLHATVSENGLNISVDE